MRPRLIPSHLPAVRDGLAERYAADLRRREEEGVEPWFRLRMERCWGTQQSLRSAPCWWVCRDMCALAVDAASCGVGVPDVEPQTASGLIAFEEPLPIDCAPDLPWGVAAMHWQAGWRDGDRLPVAVEFFASDPRALAEAGEGELPLTSMPVDTFFDSFRAREVLRAVWALSAEPYVCEVREEDAPPRRGQVPASDPMARRVKVLVLREHDEPRGRGGEGRCYNHRFIVRGHWRNQACGPGLSERRATWVAPYVKGPAWAPLVARETVRVWRR